jgi:hypothetical protein
MPNTLRPKQHRHPADGEFVIFVFGYIELLAAWCESRLQKADRRDYPVALASSLALRDAQTINLWLLHQGHVEHLQPSLAGSDGRSGLVVVDRLILSEDSHFVLTDRGVEFAQALILDMMLAGEKQDHNATWEELLLGQLLPRFDPEQRVFSWGWHLLKSFRQPAFNQELILRTGEELSWPDWFDDPLPKVAGKSPKVRLHETIQNLNRRQKKPLIRFTGDGTGRRIGWEFR